MCRFFYSFLLSYFIHFYISWQFSMNVCFWLNFYIKKSWIFFIHQVFSWVYKAYSYGYKNGNKKIKSIITIAKWYIYIYIYIWSIEIIKMNTNVVASLHQVPLRIEDDLLNFNSLEYIYIQVYFYFFLSFLGHGELLLFRCRKWVCGYYRTLLRILSIHTFEIAENSWNFFISIYATVCVCEKKIE